MTNSPLSRLVQIHKAIGHPIRLRILAMLRDGPLCVCQITAVARLASSTISQHLAELRRAGLIAEEKSGRWVFYSLDGEESSGALELAWDELELDHDAQADRILLRELRKIDPEELCQAGLDPVAVGRKSLTAAVKRAEKLRRS